jgi:hypothetical protein
MDVDVNVEVEDTVVDKLAKLLIGSAVGFIATTLATNAYDHFIKNRRS